MNVLISVLVLVMLILNKLDCPGVFIVNFEQVFVCRNCPFPISFSNYAEKQAIQNIKIIFKVNNSDLAYLIPLDNSRLFCNLHFLFLIIFHLIGNYLQKYQYVVISENGYNKGPRKIIEN